MRGTLITVPSARRNEAGSDSVPVAVRKRFLIKLSYLCLIKWAIIKIWHALIRFYKDAFLLYQDSITVIIIAALFNNYSTSI